MIDLLQLNFNKLGGLIPACIQDQDTLQVLMIGFMDKTALEATLATGRVTFFSRSKNRLWTKGESSGHWLDVISIAVDCDDDSLLIFARSHGPTCHTGATSCFDTDMPPLYWLGYLNQVIAARKEQAKENSYTQTLFAAGIKRMAQKVGEEGVEVALAAMADDQQALAAESVDLLYHLLVLLRAKNLPMSELAAIIAERRKL